MTQVEKEHLVVVEQRGELGVFLAGAEWKRGGARAVGEMCLREDGQRLQSVGIAACRVRLALLGVNEDGARLRRELGADERIVREEEAVVLPDGEGGQTFAARSGAPGELAVRGMSVVRGAHGRADFAGDVAPDGAYDE